VVSLGSKRSSFGLLHALLAALLVLGANAAQAEISKEEARACTKAEMACHDKCGKDCKGNQTCLADCGKVCEIRQRDCIDDADKSVPVPSTPKVQPKVQPGGADTPGTDSPNVRPEGGIQQD
jgi:hypothetical protein